MIITFATIDASHQKESTMADSQALLIANTKTLLEFLYEKNYTGIKKGSFIFSNRGEKFSVFISCLMRSSDNSLIPNIDKIERKKVKSPPETIFTNDPGENYEKIAVPQTNNRWVRGIVIVSKEGLFMVCDMWGQGSVSILREIEERKAVAEDLRLNAILTKEESEAYEKALALHHESIEERKEKSRISKDEKLEFARSVLSKSKMTVFFACGNKCEGIPISEKEEEDLFSLRTEDLMNLLLTKVTFVRMKKELPHNSFVFSIKTNQGNSCYKSFTNLKSVYSTEKEAKEVSEAEKTHQESLSKQIAELQCIGKIVGREFVLIFKNYASIAAVHERQDLPNGTIVGLEVDAGVQLFRLTQAKITPY